MRVIEGGRPGVYTNLPRQLSKDVVEICGWIERMAGFFVIAWDFEGASSVGWRIHTMARFPVTLLPQFLADAARRNIAQLDAQEMLGLDEDPDPGA